MYTQDCLTHDVYQQQNADDSIFDENCGDEFRATISDTFLAFFNIFQYHNSNHHRAADGGYLQDNNTGDSSNNNDDGFDCYSCNYNDQTIVIP